MPIGIGMRDSATSTISGNPASTPDRGDERPEDAAGGEERRHGPREHGRDDGLYPPKHPGRSTRMIGEGAVDLGFAELDTVEEAAAPARAQGRPAGLVLVECGILAQDQLARVVAVRFGLYFVDLSV